MCASVNVACGSIGDRKPAGGAEEPPTQLLTLAPVVTALKHVCVSVSLGSPRSPPPLPSLPWDSQALERHSKSCLENHFASCLLNSMSVIPGERTGIE